MPQLLYKTKNSFPNLSSTFWFFFSLLIVLKPSCQATQSLPNSRLLNAYKALQAWKHAIISDPNNITSNWYGEKVCNYTGVFCTFALDDPHITTVAGIDLNGKDIAGSLPEELGLLTDIALFHLNSNRFGGTIPKSFFNLHLLYELDISNNCFTGSFPSVILSLPSLKYLDLRFNEFEGSVPSTLFDLKLDAIFLNDNKFQSSIPNNIGNSPASVIVLANNKFTGGIPCSLAKMGGTLNEISLMNMSLNGCLPREIGELTNLTIFDVSFNDLVGPLPEMTGGMKDLEEFNVAHNKLSCKIPASLCSLPRLANLTYSYNYISGESPKCYNIAGKEDRQNCIPGRPWQRSAQECKSFVAHPLNCANFGYSAISPSPSPAVASLMLSPVYLDDQDDLTNVIH
ncbi:leucine-rich repeat extensin-like protein 6 [Telopea speciosissima]|uniref:leucine-rich repeat extensin-like protein 6 n=1 Tax=Telopea speciosissima TaxID=54955 RepID=UPI001CC41EE3|nr:leucine-rich repeat extensin-like protein 6 [Telopea speciosissima]